MVEAQFQTVYDLAQTGYDAWHSVSTGLILSAIGAAMVLFPSLLKTTTSGWRIFAWVYFLFAVGWTVIVFSTTYGTYSFLLGRLQSGEYQIAEGIVENFDPIPEEGHKHESFDVAGQHFEYSDFDLSRGGFNNAASHGGPIRAGLYVRISHVKGVIVRIEVRRSP